MMQMSAEGMHEVQNSVSHQVLSGIVIPVPTTCVDGHSGALNRLGNSCEVYSHDPEAPCSVICLDALYDDSDFSSSMCCVRPESCPVEEPIVHEPGDCEDWFTFSASNEDGRGRSSHSNLAGLGPDFQEPRELRYYGVGWLHNGDHVDISSINTSQYIPRNTYWNKIVGSQAVVNLFVGEFATLIGKFVRYHTFCPETPFLPKLTFCRNDDYTDGGIYILIIDVVSAIYTVDGDFDDDLESFESTSAHLESPNPLT
ncbi:unnamed protein product [Prorocentrum cordatum]|uniref:Uncharacterized protein n=1 Tax=Prorocentrum cordatum TaxID=2364126 RepID=A0ABN9XRQ7_9DINO|nr:unnamed protein product [Polarella glacialis]